jgi:hypothetical protein
MLIFQTEFNGATDGNHKFLNFLRNYVPEKPGVESRDLLRLATRIESYPTGPGEPNIAEAVDRAARYYNIDPNLLWAVIFKESSGNYFRVEATKYDGTEYYLQRSLVPDSVSLTQCHYGKVEMPVGNSPDATFIRNVLQTVAAGRVKAQNLEDYLKNAIMNKSSLLVSEIGSAESLPILEAKLANFIRPVFVFNDYQIGIILGGQVSDDVAGKLYGELGKLGTGKGLPVGGLNGTQFYVSKCLNNKYRDYSVSMSAQDTQYILFENITISKKDKDGLAGLRNGEQYTIKDGNGICALLVEREKDGTYKIYNFKKRIGPEDQATGVSQPYEIIKAAATIRSLLDKYGVSVFYAAYNGGDKAPEKLLNATGEFGPIAKNVFTFLSVYKQLLLVNFHQNMLERGLPGVKEACERISSTGGFVNDRRPLYGFNFDSKAVYVKTSPGKVGSTIAMN